MGVPIAWWKVFAAFGATFLVGVVTGSAGALIVAHEQKKREAAKPLEANLRA